MAPRPLFLSGSLADRFVVWKIEEDSVRLGRSSRNGIQMSDPTVSKEHAEISRQGEGFRIRDLGSRNGTRVNGKDAREWLDLRPGDSLEIGHVALLVSGEEPSRELRYNEQTIMGSSLKLRADELLDRRARGGGQASGALVPLLAEAGRMLVLPRPLRETCDEILRFVERAIPASRHLLLLRESPDREPTPMASRSSGAGEDRPLALSRSIARMVLDECTSVLTADAAMDPRFMGQHSIVAQSVHSAMAVPLYDNERVLGLIYVDSQDPRVRFADEQLELLTLLANMAAVKITNARLLETEEARLRMVQELVSATRIQRGLLPAVVPELPGWDIDAHLETCFEVGGDLYDVRIRPDGRLQFTIADVSGKGMGAALLMSSFLASVRVLDDTCANPGDLATRLNAIMFRSTEPQHFITGVVGCLDPKTGVAHLVNAGHNDTYIVSASGVRALPSTGVPFAVLPEFPYRQDEVVLEPGDLVALFTDGIPEAEREGEFFDEARFKEALMESRDAGDIGAVRAAVLRRIDTFLAGAPRTDDVTLLLIRRKA